MKEQIEAVQRMQDYIDMYLYETIKPADLAKVSLYSPWYSYRLFIKFLNISPADYIRRMRLSKSALKLRDENMHITDIAFDVGFGSVDGYQRAFFREFACNPKEYVLNPIPIYLFKPYGIKYVTIENRNNIKKGENMDSINKKEKTNFVFIQIVEKPARKVLIKRGIKATDYFTYCEEVDCSVWGLLTSIKSISDEPLCLWLPKSYIKNDTSEYVQGVEVSMDYDGIIPEDLDMIELPPCKYMMFQGEPFAEEEYNQAIELIWDAMTKYDPSVLGYSWDKTNPRIQLEPIGARGYIELLAIK